MSPNLVSALLGLLEKVLEEAPEIIGLVEGILSQAKNKQSLADEVRGKTADELARLQSQSLAKAP